MSNCQKFGLPKTVQRATVRNLDCLKQSSGRPKTKKRKKKYFMSPISFRSMSKCQKFGLPKTVQRANVRNLDCLKQSSGRPKNQKKKEKRIHVAELFQIDVQMSEMW